MRRQLQISESGVIFVFGIVISSVLQSIFSFALQRVGSFGGMSIGTWVAYPMGTLSFFFTAFIYLKVRKCDFLYITRTANKPRFISFILLPIIAVLTVVAFYPLTSMFLRLLALIGYNGGVTAPTDYTPGVFILALVIMAIFPAIGEEYFMRGTIYNGIASRGAWFGIAMTALLFMLMHANPYQTVYQFALGVVLVLVFIISDSIWASIIVHFLNNFISLTVTAYIPAINNIDFGNMWPLYDILLFIGGTIVLIFMLYFFYRLSHSGKKDNGGEYKIVTEDFTITARSEKETKSNAFVDSFKFFFSLFTKKGWSNLNNKLFNISKVEYIGRQGFRYELGFWLALIVAIVQWVLVFVVGMIR